jgi:hypothetical protein
MVSKKAYIGVIQAKVFGYAPSNRPRTIPLPATGWPTVDARGFGIPGGPLGEARDPVRFGQPVIRADADTDLNPAAVERMRTLICIKVPPLAVAG